MTNEFIVDLDQELAALFNKEELLAFFDFHLTAFLPRRISGMCKISRPKAGTAMSKYLSLLFITDTPDKQFREDIQAHLVNIPWDRMKKYLPDFKYVLPLPDLHPLSEMIIKEADLYFGGNTDLSKAYVSEKLYPALLEVAGLQSDELVFWDDIPVKAGFFSKFSFLRK